MCNHSSWIWDSEPWFNHSSRCSGPSCWTLVHVCYINKPLTVIRAPLPLGGPSSALPAAPQQKGIRLWQSAAAQQPTASTFGKMLQRRSNGIGLWQKPAFHASRTGRKRCPDGRRACARRLPRASSHRPSRLRRRRSSRSRLGHRPRAVAISAGPRSASQRRRRRLCHGQPSARSAPRTVPSGGGSGSLTRLYLSSILQRIRMKAPPTGFFEESG